MTATVRRKKDYDRRQTSKEISFSSLFSPIHSSDTGIDSVNSEQQNIDAASLVIVG